jgi:hypothetical protein
MVKAEGIEEISFNPGNGVESLVLEDDVETFNKVNIPTPPTPEPLTAENLKGNLSHSVDIQNMPPPNNTLNISSIENIPPSSELTGALVRTQEMISAVNALIKELPALIEKAVAKTVEIELNKAIDEAQPKSTDTPRMIAVRKP